MASIISSRDDKVKRKYKVTTLDGKKAITTVTVIGRGEQKVVNALVQRGYNPLLYTWKPTK